MNLEIPTTFVGLLIWIGTPAFIGAVISLMAQNWLWFQNRSRMVKSLIILVVSVGLPILSFVLTTYLPAPVVTFMEQIWPLIATGLGIWLSSQVWHAVVNRPFGIGAWLKKN